MLNKLTLTCVGSPTTMPYTTIFLLVEMFPKALDYRDIIVGPVIAPFEQVGPQFQVMHDIARPHTASVLKALCDFIIFTCQTNILKQT